MSRPPQRTSLLLLALVCGLLPLSLTAQIHEGGDPPVDLTRALALKLDLAKQETPLGPPTQTNVGQQSFAFSMLLDLSAPLAEMVLAQQSDDQQGWRLLLTAEGGLRLEGRTKDKADPYVIATLPGVIAPGSHHHLVINVMRDATKPNAGIWVDGIELTSGVMPPINLSSPEPLRTVAATQVRLYQRDLMRTEVLELQLEAAGGAQVAAAHKESGGSFAPEAGETIALIGGTEAVALAESGELEAMLLAAYPQTRFHFRCLAWEGDTVFRQDRPMNFGDLGQQLERLNAGTVFVMFGRQECLELGKAGAADFQGQLDKLLSDIAKHTNSMVVIGPAPFEEKAAPLPSLKAENTSLRDDYELALQQAAKKHGAIFADVLKGWPVGGKKQAASSGWTTDGVTFTTPGLRTLARVIGQSLGLTGGTSGKQPDITPAVVRLIPVIQSKNALWHAYWRPSNWAFLHGDRTQQPSSRDADNPQLRFFPAEQERYLPLLKNAEDQVYQLADQVAAKKLP